MRFVLVFLALLLFGCSGWETSQKEKLRMQNSKKEYICRRGGTYLYNLQKPIPRQREEYPWEIGKAKDLPRITKEFFRCKGSMLNPVKYSERTDRTYEDCEGAEKHSLPIVHGKEGVYPILLDILNYLQIKTQKKVVITCGHRCPLHNAYADYSKNNRISKHMIGAEVDFYVEGMQNQPHKIVDLLLQYYQEMPCYKDKEQYQKFSRYEGNSDVVTLPWYNQEIFIKLYQKDEGRDFDNRHPYPYISLQVRYDKQLDRRVCYNWQQANNLHLR